MPILFFEGSDPKLWESIMPLKDVAFWYNSFNVDID